LGTSGEHLVPGLAGVSALFEGDGLPDGRFPGQQQDQGQRSASGQAGQRTVTQMAADRSLLSTDGPPGHVHRAVNRPVS